MKNFIATSVFLAYSIFLPVISKAQEQNLDKVIKGVWKVNNLSYFNDTSMNDTDIVSVQMKFKKNGDFKIKYKLNQKYLKKIDAESTYKITPKGKEHKVSDTICINKHPMIDFYFGEEGWHLYDGFEVKVIDKRNIVLIPFPKNKYSKTIPLIKSW